VAQALAVMNNRHLRGYRLHWPRTCDLAEISISEQLTGRSRTFRLHDLPASQCIDRPNIHQLVPGHTMVNRIKRYRLVTMRC